MQFSNRLLLGLIIKTENISYKIKQDKTHWYDICLRMVTTYGYDKITAAK